MIKTFNISGKFVNNLQTHPIQVTLLIDDAVLWSEPVLIEQTFDIAVNDWTKAKHPVIIRFEGKANASPDTNLTCEYLKINNFNIEPILENHSKFHHNFNQPGEWNETMMYGNVVGIDGELKFELETPVAFWIGKLKQW